MRLFNILIFVYFFVTNQFVYAQAVYSVPKSESNTIFVKVKDSSKERVIYPTSHGKMQVNGDLKKIIDLYKINSIQPAFKITEKTDARLKKVYVLTFPVNNQREAIMNAIRRLTFIDYVEAIPVYGQFANPNDLNAQQWYLPKIKAPQAWDLSTGSGKVIAIVDDAVRISHEDLAANIWNNPLEIAGNNIDDDGNGYIDDIHGYDVADNDNDPMVPTSATNSEFTHGTHCSGIASGVGNNGKGIASIGYSNKIMAVKCKQSADTGPSLPFVYFGLQYAIESGADVISMSWGGGPYSATFQLIFDVAYDKGIICVAAAGNSNTNIPMYPASYNHVISVAATDKNDVRTYFSNYGSTVDVSAPGLDIYSTLAGSDNAYGMLSGTSMACPLVSGLCALMLSYDPNLSPDDVERCLKNNADNIDNVNSGFVGQLGAGRINAYKTMLCLQKTPTALFESDKQLVCPGQTVSYIDKSSFGSNVGVTWSWSFPGGIPSTSSIQNPTVVYNTAGTYSSTLTVTNTFGKNVLTKSNYVVVKRLSAILSGSASIPIAGQALLKVDFLNSVAPYSITYTDGTTPVTIANITSNPYYFTVTPSSTSTYNLTAVSTPFCSGTYTGNAVVSIGGLASTNCSGVSSVIVERAFGNTANDLGNNLIQSNTGENYLVGMNNANTAAGNFSLSKLNSAWDIVWTKSIGTTATEYIYNSVKSTDGNILICGTTTINGALDAYVAKVDFNGNILWTKTYGGLLDEYAFSIQNTSDGGYIITGRSESFSVGIAKIDSYIIKINASGAIQWSKSFGKQGNDYCFTAFQTLDGGYITASASQRVINTNYDYFITKFDGTGNLVWSKYYGSDDDEGPRKLIICSDGSFLIAGHSRYRGIGADAMLTKLDANGNLLWTKVFGGDQVDDPSLLSEDADGNYLVAGVTNSYGAGMRDVFFCKFDKNGNLLWSKTYGGTNDDYLTSYGKITLSADGGYAFVATTSSFGAGNADQYLIKTDCNGKSSCTSSNVIFKFFPTIVSLVDATNLVIVLNAPGEATPISSSTNINLTSNSVCVAAACTIVADFNSSDTTICKGASIALTSTSVGATKYDWYIDNTKIGQSVASIQHTFPSVGAFQVVLVASNTGCSDSDTLTIYVKDIPQLKVTKDTTICNTASVQLLVSGAKTYSWSNALGLSCTNCPNPIATPPNTKYYYVTGTDVNGCENTDSIKVTIKCCVNGKISPQASFSFSDTTICVNDIITVINLSYTSINNVSAAWDFGPAATPQFSSAVQPGNIKFTKSGRWPVTLIVQDNCGKDTLINYINVFNPPVIEPYNDVAICAPEDSIRFNIVPVSDFSYTWTPTTGLSNPMIANPWVTLTNTSRVYYRKIKDNVTGCETQDTVKVSAHQSFSIQAMNDTSIVAGETVVLKACCGNYTWNPSIFLNNSVAKNPFARPTSTIKYYVQGIDTIGCIAKDSVIISVIFLEPIIPNLFTPNGDSFNDTFEIKNLCPNSTVEIYNRWGDLVYKSIDYKNDWNAKDDSEGLYYITFKNGCGGKLYKSWLQVLAGN